MTQKLVNEAKGLKTYKNELIHPDGAQIIADNVIIDRDNVIEPRRGFSLFADTFGVSTDRAKQLVQYKNRLLLHYDDKLMFETASSSFATFDGSYEELDSGLRIKGEERNGNFYFTTSSGVKKISATSADNFSDASGYIYEAGAAKGLDGEGVANTGISGFLPAQSVVAYRMVWGYKDANDNLVLGTPSQRIIVRNLASPATAVVDLEFTIPDEVTDDSKYFYQIYRSANTDDSTDPGTATPPDELQLVFEDFPTSTDFTNGYVTTNDITPEDFQSGGAYLYTNPVSGEGILQSNEKPPVCKDLTEYRNSIFYANTKTRHQKTVALISSTTLSYDDTIIIGNADLGDTTFTFKATEDVAANEVYLATGGSVSQNIDDTAKSLVKVINRNSGPVYAYYISGIEDVPGQMLFEARELDDAEFYVKVGNTSYGKAFNPTLPVTDTETSTNLEAPNRVYFSKTNLPEAIPSTNYIDVGAKDDPIVRISALRNSLLIFKTDGIYRISGTDTENFTLNLEDSSALITAADSLAVLNNEIYVATTQGIVVVTEAGGNPKVISRDIEDLILEPRTYSAFSTGTFGVSYESDRSYIIFMPSIANDTVATQAYRYNVFTQTWVRWNITKTCGLVANSDDKLYFGAADTNQIEKERKNFDRTDYSDRQYTNSITANAVDGVNVKLGNLINVDVADAIFQEMYVTITRFNRLLLKLDLDYRLDDKDYYSSLAISAGAAMNNALASVITKVSNDDTIGSYTAPSGSNIFTVLRDEFNTFMDELNASAGTFFATYRKYTDLIPFESVILSISSGLNQITLLDSLPLIQGEITIFDNIAVEVEWSPESVGDVSLQKQFREATIMFDQFNFSSGEFSFRSDLSDNYEGMEFFAEGNGSYGSQTFGESTYGGYANQVPHRTYVPRNKQRCRFLNLRFVHKAARERFAITGYSVTFNGSTSERAYKG